MLESGFSRKSAFWRTLGIVVWFGAISARLSPAQSPKPAEPPAPLGSPGVANGAAANPFGPPPMAIGPALPPGFIGPAPRPFFFGPPIPPAYGYPPPRYLSAPYVARRASPFDAPGGTLQAPYPNRPAPPIPMLDVPRSVESPTLANQLGAVPAMVTPAAIGNLRLLASENFLNRIVAKDEQKPGSVQDFILGAQVTGRQTTDTKVRLDLLPSNEQARGAIVLTGVTESQTTGVTPQAMVDTASHQQFRAVKELYFDGIKFSTRHAVVYVRARNQTLGAVTPLTGSLIGGIANRIAFRAAEKRQAEGEAIARDKVAERVFPEFDNGIDSRLASANDQLEEKLRPILRRTNFMPTQQQLFSTDTYLSYSIQLGDQTPTESTGMLEGQVNKDDGVHVLIHETLLNDLAARSGLKGLKTNDQQIRALLAPYEMKSTTSESDPGQASISLPGMDNVATSIEFDESNPLTIKLEQDRAVVTMRATFKPAGQDLLPPLAVTIEYKTAVEGEKVVATPGKVQVALQNRDDNTATTGFALKLISQVIESSLSKLAVDRNLPPQMWPFSSAIPRVTGIRSQDGWAAVSIN